MVFVDWVLALVLAAVLIGAFLAGSDHGR